MSEETVDMDTEPYDDEPDTIAEDAEAEAEDSGYDSLPEVKAMEDQIKSTRTELGDMLDNDRLQAMNEALESGSTITNQDEILLTDVSMEPFDSDLDSETKKFDSAEDEGSDRSRRDAARKKKIFFVFNTVVGVLSLVFGAVSMIFSFIAAYRLSKTFYESHGFHLLADGNNSEAMKQMQKAAREWVDLDEPAHWQRVTKYYSGKKSKPLQEHLVNLQALAFLCRAHPKLRGSIQWKASEKIAIIVALKNVIKSSGAHTMYANIPKYKDKVLPRGVAADCLSHAVASVMAERRRAATVLTLKTHAPTLPTTTTTLPPMFCLPTVIFCRTGHGTSKADFAEYCRRFNRQLLETFNFKQSTDPMSTASDWGQLKITDVETHFLTSKQVKDVLSDKHARLRTLLKAMHEGLNRILPLQGGEKVVSSRITWLERPAFGAYANSPALIRITSHAATVQLFPLLVVSLEDDDIVHKEHHHGLLKFQLPSKGIKLRPLADTKSLLTKFVLPIAQTASFALPAPFGPIVASGFMAISLALRGSSDQKHFDLSGLRNDIENMFTANVVHNALAVVGGFIDEQNSDQDAWNDLNGSDIEEQVRTLDQADGRLWTAYNSLLTEVALSCRDVMDAVLVAASAIVLGRGRKCRLLALRAHYLYVHGKPKDFKAAEKKVKEGFESYRGALQTMTDAIEAKMNALHNDRLSKLDGSLASFDDRRYVCFGNGGGAAGVSGQSCTWEGGSGYTFTDRFDDDKGQATTFTKTVYNEYKDVGSFWDHLTGEDKWVHDDKKSVLQADYDQHKKQVESNWSFSEGRNVITTLKQAYGDLEKVIQGPTVSEKDVCFITDWTNDTPPEAFQKYKRVSYQVRVSSSMQKDSSAQMTVPTEPVAIVAGKSPKLSIPTFGITQDDGILTRFLYRRLLMDDGQAGDEPDLTKVMVLHDAQATVVDCKPK